jgi:CBS domain-containing protein
MAILVREIMNPELISVGPNDSIDDVRSCILGMGVTGVPVVDETGRPLGMVSLRDADAHSSRGGTARDRMSSPAVVVTESTPIRAAAQLLSDASVHRLVVVDREGRAVGIVSALDLVRGLIGEPASHPATFPHSDHETGLFWTDDHVLEMREVEAAPNGPGVFLLIAGGAGFPERPVWVEAAANVQERLTSIFSHPMRESPFLGRLLERGELRFRAAAVPDPEERERAVATLRERLELR